MYYVLSPEGEKQGPYEVKDLQAWFANKQIPAQAKIIDFNTGLETTVGSVLASPNPNPVSESPTSSGFVEYPRSQINVVSPTRGDHGYGIVMIAWGIISVLASGLAGAGILLTSGIVIKTPQFKHASMGRPIFWGLLLTFIEGVLYICGGIGINSGKTFGFKIGYWILGLGAIRAIVSMLYLSSPGSSLLGFVIPVVIGIYCFRRLTGNHGPPTIR